jgi:hypothetical protein
LKAIVLLATLVIAPSPPAKMPPPTPRAPSVLPEIVEFVTCKLPRFDIPFLFSLIVLLDTIAQPPSAIKIPVPSPRTVLEERET